MSNVRTVEMMEVIRVTHYEGEGTEANPGRLVQSYYGMDGALLARDDPMDNTEREAG